jgi:hypothetical protein
MFTTACKYSLKFYTSQTNIKFTWSRQVFNSSTKWIAALLCSMYIISCSAECIQYCESAMNSSRRTRHRGSTMWWHVVLSGWERGIALKGNVSKIQVQCNLRYRHRHRHLQPRNGIFQATLKLKQMTIHLCLLYNKLGCECTKNGNTLRFSTTYSLNTDLVKLLCTTQWRR